MYSLMTTDFTKLTAKELVQKLKSKEIDSCTYSTMEEFYKGLRDHATDSS